MSIRACATVFFTFVLTKPLIAQPIPFEICAESTTWVRPSPEIQSKIWNDSRYGDAARADHAWTHNFIVIDDPESASIPYHLQNVSGLWTAPSGAFQECYSNKKVRRSGYEWIEVWSLLHRVKEVRRDANTYTVTVEPVGAGFQWVYIRRMNQAWCCASSRQMGRNLSDGMNPRRRGSSTKQYLPVR